MTEDVRPEKLRLGTQTCEQAAEQVWTDVLRRVDEGDPPPLPALAELIKCWGVPAHARDYVAARVRDEKLGPPGAPPRGRTTWLGRIVAIRQMIREVDRRAKRYKTCRLDAPRSKTVRRDGVVPTLPRPATKEVLRGSRGASGDWTRASGGKWKLRAPVDYAIRRVAFRWGVDPEKLKRWRKDRAQLPRADDLPDWTPTSHLWGTPRDSW